MVQTLDMTVFESLARYQNYDTNGQICEDESLRNEERAHI